jgi:putative flippase GtrA
MQFSRQLVGYAIVGVITNALGYSVYLLLTYWWGAPKLSITSIYFIAAAIGFFANKHFTFRHKGKISEAGVRYLLVQVAGYLLNLCLLMLFVDWLGFSHKLVQAFAIFIVAIFLFFLLRKFVFTTQ